MLAHVTGKARVLAVWHGRDQRRRRLDGGVTRAARPGQPRHTARGLRQVWRLCHFRGEPLHLSDVPLRRCRQVVLRVFGEPRGGLANRGEVGMNDRVPDRGAEQEVLAHPGTHCRRGLARRLARRLWWALGSGERSDRVEGEQTKDEQEDARC